MFLDILDRLSVPARTESRKLTRERLITCATIAQRSDTHVKVGETLLMEFFLLEDMLSVSVTGVSVTGVVCQ